MAIQDSKNSVAKSEDIPFIFQAHLHCETVKSQLSQIVFCQMSVQRRSVVSPNLVNVCVNKTKRSLSVHTANPCKIGSKYCRKRTIAKIGSKYQFKVFEKVYENLICQNWKQKTSCGQGSQELK